MNNGVPVNFSSAIVAFFAPIICAISDLKVTDVSFFLTFLNPIGYLALSTRIILLRVGILTQTVL